MKGPVYKVMVPKQKVQEKDVEKDYNFLKQNQSSISLIDQEIATIKQIPNIDKYGSSNITNHKGLVRAPTGSQLWNSPPRCFIRMMMFIQVFVILIMIAAYNYLDQQNLSINQNHFLMEDVISDWNKPFITDIKVSEKCPLDYQTIFSKQWQGLYKSCNCLAQAPDDMELSDSSKYIFIGQDCGVSQLKAKCINSSQSPISETVTTICAKFSKMTFKNAIRPYSKYECISGYEKCPGPTDSNAICVQNLAECPITQIQLIKEKRNLLEKVLKPLVNRIGDFQNVDEPPLLDGYKVIFSKVADFLPIVSFKIDQNQPCLRKTDLNSNSETYPTEEQKYGCTYDFGSKTSTDQRYGKIGNYQISEMKLQKQSGIQDIMQLQPKYKKYVNSLESAQNNLFARSVIQYQKSCESKVSITEAYKLIDSYLNYDQSYLRQLFMPFSLAVSTCLLSLMIVIYYSQMAKSKNQWIYLFKMIAVSPLILMVNVLAIFALTYYLQFIYRDKLNQAQITKQNLSLIQNCFDPIVQSDIKSINYAENEINMLYVLCGFGITVLIIFTAISISVCKYKSCALFCNYGSLDQMIVCKQGAVEQDVQMFSEPESSSVEEVQIQGNEPESSKRSIESQGQQNHQQVGVTFKESIYSPSQEEIPVKDSEDQEDFDNLQFSSIKKEAHPELRLENITGSEVTFSQAEPFELQSQGQGNQGSKFKTIKKSYCAAAVSNRKRDHKITSKINLNAYLQDAEQSERASARHQITELPFIDNSQMLSPDQFKMPFSDYAVQDIKEISLGSNARKGPIVDIIRQIKLETMKQNSYWTRKQQSSKQFDSEEKNKTLPSRHRLESQKYQTEEHQDNKKMKE